MFYKTQIAKLGVGGIIDTAGKRLRFIGNLPAKEGDWVWTDGNVIFGHVPIRGTPSIPIPQGGIPVRAGRIGGYFTDSGTFHKCRIDCDDWIVNGEKDYFTFEGEVFDAELAVENEKVTGLYTAEIDGINGGNQGIYVVKKLDNEDGELIPGYGGYNSAREYMIDLFGEDAVNNAIEKDRVFIFDDDAVVIKKDGVQVQKIFLHDYTEAFNKLDEIRNEISKDYPCVDTKALAGHVQLLNFHLKTDGNWDALIASFVLGVLGYHFDGEEYDPVYHNYRHSLMIYYLVHVKSNGQKEILHEDIHVEGTFFSKNGEYIFRVDYPDVKNYKSSWRYPIQDGYSVEMNEWRILNIFDHDGQPIINNMDELDFSQGFPDRMLFLDEPVADSFFRLESKSETSPIITLAPILRSEVDLDDSGFGTVCDYFMDYGNGGFYSYGPVESYAPKGHTELAFRYISPYHNYASSYIFKDYFSKYTRPYINLPAVVKLKKGYLVGIPCYGVYKVGANGIATRDSHCTSDLANLRFRKMKKISDAKKKRRD